MKIIENQIKIIEDQIKIKVLERARFLFPNGGDIGSLIPDYDKGKYKCETFTVPFGEEFLPITDTWDQ